MRLVTTIFEEFIFWLSSIEEPKTAFHFQAGAEWEDGELVYYLNFEDGAED